MKETRGAGCVITERGRIPIMEYIALRLHNGVTLRSGAARTLVGYALRRFGHPTWSVTSIELFAGGGSGETLLIARPSEGVEVHLADYALPLMRKYFSD